MKKRRCFSMFGNNNRRRNFSYGYSGQVIAGFPSNIGRNTGYSPAQSYPYPAPPQNYQWSTYQPPNPYYPGSIQPLNQQPQGGYMQQQFPNSPQSYPPKNSQFLFQNPLAPQEEVYQNQAPQMNGYPMMNPYPKQNMGQKQPGGMQSFMNSFKSQDGSVDFNKMMNTAGQMMTAVNQVSSLVKGLGGIFKA